MAEPLVSSTAAGTPSPLAALQELPLPDPVPYTPQTVGWWIVLAVVLILLSYVVWRWQRYCRSNRYRVEALRELADIERTLRHDPAAARRLPVLIKRVVLASAPRSTVAALSGEAWLQWLDDTLPRAGFLSAPGQLLPALAYGSLQGIDPQQLTALVALLRRWIREHRVHS